MARRNHGDQEFVRKKKTPETVASVLMNLAVVGPNSQMTWNCLVSLMIEVDL